MFNTFGMVLARKVPEFIHSHNRVDANQRRPDHPDYDPNSLYISPDEFLELTDGMKRYWNIKKNNMEKIMFWRFGDWYVLYFEDLHICSKYLELCITPFPGSP